MSEEKPDRRGTFWDWPVGVIVAGVVLLFVAGGNGATAGLVIALVVIALGAVTLMARRGVFSPRR